jgi:hypothetical protein
MEPAVTEDHGSRCPVPLVDGEVDDPDQNREFVGGSPRFPVNPGQELRVEPVDPIPHAIDDGGPVSGSWENRIVTRWQDQTARTRSVTNRV